MKIFFRILGSLVLMGIVLVLVSIAYSTVKGHMTWYFRVNGQVTVDGHKTSGYMHANTDRTILLVTRTDGKGRETYSISLSYDKGINDCGEWNPPRFFPIAVGDVNPPCLVVEPAKVIDAPLARTLVRERRSVQFSTASGKKVKAEW